MNIEISSIHNHGNYLEEYVSLKVNEDCDAGRFILADTTYTPDKKVSSLLRHVYWLPDKQVKKGDFIWVHTKEGKQSENANKAGSTTHHFYWGLKVSIWNDDGDCGALFHYDAWMTKPATQAN